MFISKPFHDPKVWGYEDWLVSTLEKTSTIDGKPIVEIGNLLGDLQYLVKVLKTHQNLSVQVHPSNELVATLEKGLKFGKDECWLITDADPGAGIFMGVREQVGLSDLRDAIENKSDVSKLMNFIPVSKGDFFKLPAGTIHALGAGVELVEVQTAVDITYRLWDWNREPARELHIDKGLQCCDLGLWREDDLSLRQRNCNNQNLITHRLFEVDLYSVDKNKTIFFKNKERAKSIIVIAGKLEFDNKFYEKFSCCILGKDIGECELKGSSDLQVMVVS